MGYLSVSPDGTKLLYSNGANGKLMVYADGSETWTGLSTNLTAWRSDGEKIFYSVTGAGSSNGVYVMNADLTGGSPYSTGSTFIVTDFAYLDPRGSPDGTSPQCANGVDDDADGPVDLDDFGCQNAQDDSESDDPDPEQILAAAFRPHLRFDAGEHWRPISVDALLAEQVNGVASHQACFRDASDTNHNCTPILRTQDLLDFAAIPHGSDEIVLDIAGNETSGGDAADYHAPSLADCAVTADRDCDSGPNSLVYYNRTVREVPSEGPGDKSYWDYWYFFRYNHSFYSLGCSTGILEFCFEHEGDWEGITVVTAVEPDPTVYWVSFAGHNYLPRRYTAEALREANRFDGNHIGVYVAAGTHGAYSFPCNGVPAICVQDDDGIGLPDGQHGGEEPWSRNDDQECRATCVQPLPEASTEPTDGPEAAGWASWSGFWGNPCSSFGCGRQYGPQSPGNQRRYQFPWEVKESSDPPFFLHSESRELAGAGIADCSSWFGSDVAALACDASTLLRTVTHSRFEEPGALRLLIRNERSGSSWPGLAQVLGNPVRSGDSLRLTGRARANTPLLLRVRLASRVIAVARFVVGDFPRNESVTVRVDGTSASPKVHLTTPNGRLIHPYSVTLPLRAPIRLTAIRRSGTLTLSFVAGGPRTKVWIVRESGHKPLEHIVATRPNERRNLAVPAPRGKATIVAATVTRSGTYSFPVSAAIK
jgi:hypothetical protein